MGKPRINNVKAALFILGFLLYILGFPIVYLRLSHYLSLAFPLFIDDFPIIYPCLFHLSSLSFPLFIFDFPILYPWLFYIWLYYYLTLPFPLLVQVFVLYLLLSHDIIRIRGIRDSLSANHFSCDSNKPK